MNLGWRLPNAVGRIIGGRFFDGAYAPANPADALAGFDELIVKPALGAASGAGKDVRVLPGAEAIAFAQGATRSGRENDWIIQELVRQSSTTARLNPSSVNTLRLTTLYVGERPEVIGAYVRIGLAGMRVDDKDGAGLECTVRDGVLDEIAYDQKFRPCAAHPDSGLKFGGIALPGWADACAMTTGAHSRLPELGMLSWDVAFDERDAPIVIEVNPDRQEIAMHQIARGPLFGARTAEIRARTRARTFLGHVIG
jgi:hypothetical protein